jgi:hypothetical protein
MPIAKFLPENPEPTPSLRSCSERRTAIRFGYKESAEARVLFYETLNPSVPLMPGDRLYTAR